MWSGTGQRVARAVVGTEGRLRMDRLVGDQRVARAAVGAEGRLRVDRAPRPGIKNPQFAGPGGQRSGVNHISQAPHAHEIGYR